MLHTFLFFDGMKIDAGEAGLFFIEGTGLGLSLALKSAAAASALRDSANAPGLIAFGGDCAGVGRDRMVASAAAGRSVVAAGPVLATTFFLLPSVNALNLSSLFACSTLTASFSARSCALGAFRVTNTLGAGLRSAVSICDLAAAIGTGFA